MRPKGMDTASQTTRSMESSACHVQPLVFPVIQNAKMKATGTPHQIRPYRAARRACSAESADVISSCFFELFSIGMGLDPRTRSGSERQFFSVGTEAGSPR